MITDMEEFVTKVDKSEKKKNNNNMVEKQTWTGDDFPDERFTKTIKGKWWKWEEEFQKPIEQRVYNNPPWSRQGNQRTNVETGTTVTIPYEDDRLDNLVQEIIQFYQELGIQLGIWYAKIEEIALDHIQYRGIKDKAFHVLMAWFDEPPRDSLKYEKLFEALKYLHMGRIAKLYC